jgi:hypothetical protein
MQIFRLAFTGLALTGALCISSCGGGEKKEADKKETATETAGETPPKPADNGPASKLEGAWEIKRAEGMMSETNLGTVYEFEGSKLSFGKDGYKNPGKTEVTDSTFSFQADGNELKFMYNYKFNGDTLVVEMQKSGGQIFHMVKK